MKGKGWQDWDINSRGELHHQTRPDLVFTPDQLIGLHFHFQQLAAERAELRGQVQALEKILNMKAPDPRDTNLVIFPRHVRQRP